MHGPARRSARGRTGVGGKNPPSAPASRFASASRFLDAEANVRKAMKPAPRVRGAGGPVRDQANHQRDVPRAPSHSQLAATLGPCLTLLRRA